MIAINVAKRVLKNDLHLLSQAAQLLRRECQNIFAFKIEFTRCHRKGRKEDNALVAANFIEYFLCDLCAFAVNKN